MYIKFARVRENVIPPQRINGSDSGMDVFFCPENNQEVIIMPNSNAILDTGLVFEIVHGYELKAENRGSWAAKRGLIVGAEIIDSGFAGSVFIDLHNIGSTPQVIKPGDKMAQLVMREVVIAHPLEDSLENLYNRQVTISNRGDGSLGSTDKEKN